MLLHGGVVAEMTLCVTFGAPGFGPIFRYIWRRPEYFTFCTISATAVREMTVSVTFGAPRSAVAVMFWCGPCTKQIARAAREARFMPNAIPSSWLWAVYRILCCCLRACGGVAVAPDDGFGRVDFVVVSLSCATASLQWRVATFDPHVVGTNRAFVF